MKQKKISIEKWEQLMSKIDKAKIIHENQPDNKEEIPSLKLSRNFFIVEKIDLMLHSFVNSFLHRIYKLELANVDFIVNNLFTFTENISADIEYTNEVNLESILPSNKIILYQAEYKKIDVDIILEWFLDQYNRRIYNIKYKFDLNNNDSLNKDFRDFLFKESYKNSIFKNKLLKIEIDYNSDDDEAVDSLLKNLKIIKVEELHAKKIDKIYIPNFIKEEINRFCLSIEKNISSLRFIFSGLPGTAKTEILKYISKYLAGKCTIMFVSSGEHRLTSILNLADYLSPCLVCIDDIDFIVRDRDSYSNSKTLSAFLQKLDGFLDLNNVSILATTNDKNLIDIAAKRPGRFDQIIDIGEIESKDYNDLIKDCLEDDALLIDYFTEEVINDFKKNKVTGSFIVNLVKQLKIYTKTAENIDSIFIKKFIENSYKGFYKTQLQLEKSKFGFTEDE